jgi:hypothetical protein
MNFNMNILKWILKAILWIGLVILGMIALLLITGLFMKKEFSLQEEVLINRPKQEVYDYVKYLENQNNYSKWATMDPTMKQEFRGTDGTVGFVSAWDGEMIGKGEQEIVKITEGERIDYELRFIEPWPGVNQVYMITEGVSENQTRVRWGIQGPMPYPMNVTTPIMTKMFRKDFRTGLDNLKAVLER